MFAQRRPDPPPFLETLHILYLQTVFGFPQLFEVKSSIFAFIDHIPVASQFSV